MKPNKDRGLTEINLTSLVDVSLTLVIIFMVSSPFIMESGIKVSTPALEKAKNVKQATELKAEIHMKTDGSLLLNGNIIQSAIFSDSLKTLLAISKSKQVVISADGEVLHDKVIAIMDRAKQCGARKLSIIRRK